MQKTGRQMTDQTASKRQKGQQSWRLVTFGALLFLVGALFVGILARKQIAEWVLSSYCQEKSLTCKADITSLSLDEAELRSVTVLDEAGKALIIVDRIAVDLEHVGWFEIRPLLVEVHEPDLVVDLVQGAPELQALRRLAPQRSGQSASTPPPLKLMNADIALNTGAGDVNVQANADIRSLIDLSLNIEAQPTELAIDGSQLSLSRGRADIVVDSVGIKTDLDLELADVELASLSIEKAFIQLNASGPFGKANLEGRASASGLEGAGGELDALDVELTGVLGAPRLNALNIKGLLGMVQTLSLKAQAGDGRIGNALWRQSEIELELDMEGNGRVLGPLIATMSELSAYDAGIDNLQFEGRVEIGLGPDEPLLELQDGSAFAKNVRTKPGNASSSFIIWMREAAPSPIRPALTDVANAVEEALQGFDASAVINARLDTGLVPELFVSEAEWIAQNGVSAQCSSSEFPDFWQWSKPQWTAAGMCRLRAAGLSVNVLPFSASGGNGAPVFQGDIDATLSGEDMSGRFLTTGLKMEFGGVDVSGEADVLLEFDGPAYSANWNNASIAGKVTSMRTESGWQINAVDRLAVTLDGLSTRSARLGRVESSFLPIGPLLTLGAGEVSGSGRLGSISTNLSFGSRDYEIAVESSDMDWTAGQIPRADIKLNSLSLRFDLLQNPVSLAAPSADAHLTLGSHWKIEGALAEGVGDQQLVTLKDIAAHYELAGEGGKLTGSISDLIAHIHDKTAPARFTNTRFEGALFLDDGLVTGEGQFIQPGLNQMLARTELTHDLSSGNGDAQISSTVLRFQPGGLQPARLFPVLRGIVANVRGPVTLTGAAQWERNSVSTSAVLELTDLAFVSEKAGLFEGVFGRIELSDVVQVVSEPGQTLFIDVWNPGMPLTNGVVSFQLNGLESVSLESAAFPFAAGNLNTRPMVWDLKSESNHLYVDADNIDIATLLSDLGMDGFEAEGRLSGAFPVRFETGHVYLDHASLSSAKGRLGYRGKTPDLDSEDESMAVLFFEAIKDFQYDEMTLDVAGDVAGELELTLRLLGHNPAVLDGYPFDVNMKLAADLVSLFNRASMGERLVNQLRFNLAQSRRRGDGYFEPEDNIGD